MEEPSQSTQQQQRMDDMISQWTDTSTRLPTWIVLTILSMVSFVSMLYQRHAWTDAWGWAFAVTSLSVICGVISYFAYLKYKGIFVGQLPEYSLAGFLLILWVTALPVIMSPRNNIAVGIYAIENANIYFSTWIVFFCAVSLCGSLLREKMGIDLLARVGPLARTRMGKWYLLTFFSLIAMIASVEEYRAQDCSEQFERSSSDCRQTVYGIAAGVLGTIVSGAVTLITFKWKALKLEREWLAAVIMIGIWVFGLDYITTGDGAGTSIGNLVSFCASKDD